MARFLTSSNLDNEIETIISEAKTRLYLMSPYVNLSDRMKNLLIEKATQPELEIVVVFRGELLKGDELSEKRAKKESVYRNMPKIDFWATLPNVKIVSLNDLHAKFYANEEEGVITSLNLYEYSFKHNVEYGCLLEKGKVDNSFEEATRYTEKLLEEWGRVVYAKVPRYRKKKGEKVYVGSVEICNDLCDANGKKKRPSEIKSIIIVTSKTVVKKSPRSFPTTNPNVVPNEIGYCIRTGVRIPFNIEKPFCKEAFKEWEAWKNEEYPENFCHLTGEPSFGETTFKHPVMGKNWSRVKEEKQK
jgi:hypothetical protein